MRATSHQTVRTLFISDVHLGTKDCKAEFLLELLASIRCEKLYLVGDIVDFWAMKRRIFWPNSHHQVIQKIFQLANQGTDVIYIPGNHDEVLRGYRNEYFDKNRVSIQVLRQAIHTTQDGKRLLVMHGDYFDEEVCHGRFITWLGSALYDFALYLNRHFNFWRRKLGSGYWSLSSYIKSRVKGAERAIELFREAAIREVKKRGLDGIVCGHIHQPDIRTESGVLYCNDGDWVENCSALIERHDGVLELLYWTSLQSENTVEFTATPKSAAETGRKLSEQEAA